MTKKEILQKLSEEITIEEATEIFNWFMQNEFPVTIFKSDFIPKIELNSLDIKIDVPTSENGQNILRYSIAVIKKYLMKQL